MEMNNYNNNKEEFQDLSNLLKKLPKKNAPDNFEYNLLTKIQNGNFEEKKYKENKLGWSWTFAPATALVLSAILIFFVFDSSSDDFDNPLMANPPLRNAVVTNTPDTMMANTVTNNVELTSVSRNGIMDKDNKYDVSVDDEKYVVVLQPNDVVVKEKMDYPFDKRNAVNLDNLAPAGNNLRGSGGTQLVGGANNYFNFDGFFVRIRVNEELILKERARLDSLRKLQSQDFAE